MLLTLLFLPLFFKKTLYFNCMNNANITQKVQTTSNQDLTYAIPFNRPFLTGLETEYIKQSVASGKISGDGMFTKRCHHFFEQRYGFQKVLLTTSCTTALEMAAMLINTQAGDEIIMPSYTFVSTANAFVIQGAKIVFADSSPHNPNVYELGLEQLITPRTKAIVVVHYAGIACNMDAIMDIANRHNLFVIEDAAHAIDSFYNQKPLGSIGHLAAFSFHETKNVIAGEGGMLVINQDSFNLRAEIIREKGTNRTAFSRGEVQKYEWIDKGSSYLPSELIAAFLYAQLENLDLIQQKRIQIWQQYYELMLPLAQKKYFQLPQIPDYATCNGHLFYIICNNRAQRTQLIEYLKANGILAVFHYVPLHNSPYYLPYHDGRELPYAERFHNCLLRLPLFFDLTHNEQLYIVQKITDFFEQ